MNLRDLLDGKANKLPRDAIFWHFPHCTDHPASVPSSVIRKGPWKLIETLDPEGLELYNLDQDLSETTNLASSEPEKLAELKRELDAWRIELGAERMHPNPDYDPGSQASSKKKNKKTKARK